MYIVYVRRRGGEAGTAGEVCLQDQAHVEEKYELDDKGSEVAEVEPLELTGGALTFNRKLSLNVNMYYDTVNQVFLEKKVAFEGIQSIFTLIIITEKGEKSAGVVSIDFAEKLNERVQGKRWLRQSTRRPTL